MCRVDILGTHIVSVWYSLKNQMRHFLRDHETKGDIEIRHVSTKKYLADIFTKPLDETRFCALRSELNILDSHNVV